MLEHYSARAQKFQADIFGSHLTALKRCWTPDRSIVPTHSDFTFGITTSSKSVSAPASLSCEWFFLILSKVLVYIQIYLVFSNSDNGYNVRGWTKNWPFMTWPRLHNLGTYPWKLWHAELRPVIMKSFFLKNNKHVSHNYIHKCT